MKSPVEDLFVDSSGRLWLSSKGFLSAEKNKYRVRVNDKKDLQDIDVNGDLLMLFYSDGSVECFDFPTSKYLYTSVAYGKDEQETYSKSTVLMRTEAESR